MYMKLNIYTIFIYSFWEYLSFRLGFVYSNGISNHVGLYFYVERVAYIDVFVWFHMIWDFVRTVLYQAFVSNINNFQTDLRHHLEYLDNWPHLHCYTHNFSADVSFGLLQMFHVDLGILYRISNYTLYLVHSSTSDFI